jgi:hypothetical protein
LLAAEIKGRITDDQGEALPGVSVCLSVTSTSPTDCHETSLTEDDGSYSFGGLSAGAAYTVSVLTDASLDGRRDDPYPNYAWAPDNRRLHFASELDSVENIDFMGAFNFSNLQAELQLTEADFPELVDFDVAGDYVFLKVFITDSDGIQQDLVFLGQVSDMNKLLIEVSAPLPTTHLSYEIYSALSDTVAGSISLKVDR